MVPAGAVAPNLSHAIDLIETVYDFEKSDSEWLDGIIKVGAPLFDHGLGFALDEYVVTPRQGGADLSIKTVRAVSLPSDYEQRLRDAARVLKARDQWRMLGAHIAAAYRLRRTLAR